MSVQFAHQLRKRQTEAERKLWLALRSRRLFSAKFRRQRPIGRYVVDFMSVEHRLIVEVDGSQHADDTPERTRFLEARGFRVLRFWNNDVLLNLDGVLEAIGVEIRASGVRKRACGGGPPHPGPLPPVGGEGD